MILILESGNQPSAWVLTAASRSLYFPQAVGILRAEDLESLPNFHTLSFDFDALTPQELWDSLRQNIEVFDPGGVYDGMTPATIARGLNPERFLNSKYDLMLTPLAPHYQGTKQAMYLLEWVLTHSKAGESLTPERVQTLFELPGFNLHGRQSAMVVWKYYRPWYFKAGVIKYAPASEAREPRHRRSSKATQSARNAKKALAAKRKKLAKEKSRD